MKMSQFDEKHSALCVAEQLATEFDGIVPSERVAIIVLESASDLRGQVRAGAFPELLHRLAHYRLGIASSRVLGRRRRPCRQPMTTCGDASRASRAVNTCHFPAQMGVRPDGRPASRRAD